MYTEAECWLRPGNHSFNMKSLVLLCFFILFFDLASIFYTLFIFTCVTLISLRTNRRFKKPFCLNFCPNFQQSMFNLCVGRKDNTKDKK